MGHSMRTAARNPRGQVRKMAKYRITNQARAFAGQTLPLVINPEAGTGDRHGLLPLVAPHGAL